MPTIRTRGRFFRFQSLKDKRYSCYIEVQRGRYAGWKTDDVAYDILMRASACLDTRHIRERGSWEGSFESDY